MDNPTHPPAGSSAAPVLPLRRPFPDTPAAWEREIARLLALRAQQRRQDGAR